MSRYPYTDACDFIRGQVTDLSPSLGIKVPMISRSQASQCMHAFEKVFGISHEEMAVKIADYAKSTGDAA